MKSHRRQSPPENPVNFLKIILSHDTHSTGIIIPKKFTEKHGKDLLELERVILKVPNGDVWTIHLQESKSEIWLDNGWSEFAEHYGLEYGHLLMFNYEGCSIFGVIIFDKSACEIVYPPMKKNPLITRNSQQEVKVAKLKTVKSEQETYCSSSEDEKARLIKMNGGCSKKRMEDGKRAVERAKANFRSHKHMFFAYMQQSYVSKSRGLPVPVEFRKKYWSGGKKHNKYLLKLVNDGRQKTWEVLASGTHFHGAGWPKFVMDNGVTFGDICVFKLIHKHQNVLGVTILKSTP